MRWMLLLLAMAAVPGCATHALWEDADLGTWHEPSSDSTLRLFHWNKPWDLLVLYKETTEPHNLTHTRAYLLHKNESRIERQRRPEFVTVNSLDGLEAVPVFFGTNSAVGSPGPPLYAILSTNKVWFTIYSDDRATGSYSLPVYHDGLGKMERIALTPLAATADVTIVGGAIGAYAGYLYAEAVANGSVGLPPDVANWNSGKSSGAGKK